MDKKPLFIGIVLLVLGFGLGAITGVAIYPKLKKTSQGSENTYQAGWDAAKKKLEESGSPTGIKNVETKSLSGTVQKVEGGKITLKTQLLNPLADASLESRTVTVNNNTKIYLSTPKDPEQMKAEMEEFQKKMQEQGANQDLKAPYADNRKEIALTDLKEGQQIIVNAEENIADKKEFVAKEIIAQEVSSQTLSPVNLPAAPTSAATAPTASAPTDLPAPPTPVSAKKDEGAVPAPIAPKDLPVSPSVK